MLDRDADVRWSVASNRSCSDEMFEELTIDVPYVRIAVASNPACSQHVLETLIEDQDTKIRRTAAATLPNRGSPTTG